VKTLREYFSNTWLWQKLWHTTAGRVALFSLAVDVVAYTSVYFLVSNGVLGTWWANTTVSKGAAPFCLWLNTLAITGRMWPTKTQAVKWVAWWLPSASVGTIFLTLVVTHTDLQNIEARAVVGLLLFPIDYLVKRFIVFAQQTRLKAFVLRTAIWLKARTETA
jgi:hypothetical protein